MAPYNRGLMEPDQISLKVGEIETKRKKILYVSI
jgi:hypothetical protein